MSTKTLHEAIDEDTLYRIHTDIWGSDPMGGEEFISGRELLEMLRGTS